MSSNRLVFHPVTHRTVLTTSLRDRAQGGWAMKLQIPRQFHRFQMSWVCLKRRIFWGPASSAETGSRMPKGETDSSPDPPPDAELGKIEVSSLLT